MKILCVESHFNSYTAASRYIKSLRTSLDSDMPSYDSNIELINVTNLNNIMTLKNIKKSVNDSSVIPWFCNLSLRFARDVNLSTEDKIKRMDDYFAKCTSSAAIFKSAYDILRSKIASKLEYLSDNESQKFVDIYLYFDPNDNTVKTNASIYTLWTSPLMALSNPIKMSVDEDLLDALIVCYESFVDKQTTSSTTTTNNYDSLLDWYHSNRGEEDITLFGHMLEQLVMQRYPSCEYFEEPSVQGVQGGDFISVDLDGKHFSFEFDWNDMLNKIYANGPQSAARYYFNQINKRMK